MYAVIETGGKQYRVEVGTELEVELLDVEPGKTITIDRVLLVADGDESTIGRPLVADASVSAEVVSQTRGPKLISFKYRPKARSRVKKGHRQELTVLRITDITLGGKSAAKAAKKAETTPRPSGSASRRPPPRRPPRTPSSPRSSRSAPSAEKATTKTKAKPKTATEGQGRHRRRPRQPRPSQGRGQAPKPSPRARPRHRRSRPPRPTADADADADDHAKAKADAPKKPRATKKDE